MEPISLSTKIGGRTLTLETGKLARQASGSVLVTYGETTVLGTAVVAKEPREGLDFFPLKIDFDEKFYASGKIKGSRFIKREGRPAEEAILVARAIDRSIRPLFPKGFYNELQVILTVFSFDGENSADMVAAIAASAAIALSPAPIIENVAIGRVGRVNGTFIHNPTYQELQSSDLNIIIGSLEEKVVMIEANANEVPEEDIFNAVEFCLNENKKIHTIINDLSKKAGKEKIQFTPAQYNESLLEEVNKFIEKPIKKIYEKVDKQTRESIIDTIKKDTVEHFTKDLPEEEKAEKSSEIKVLFDKALKGVIRHNILENEHRVGDRKLDEIRPLLIEAGVLPRVHGSALFQRGETQAVSIVTLGGPSDGQIVDSPEEEQTKRYMHHYNFPPFSVGDISTRRYTGNREIGHGFLAEKALVPVLPPKEEFPYTIRVVSEILESNGSSSMASTCGSTLALMDAGVPIKRPVAGIAMGLIVNHHKPSEYKVLTDLQDIEDFGGDMDFKVAGTEKGITAIQVDMKVYGITFDIVRDALQKAQKGRMEIMKSMLKVLAEPRKELAPTAPRIVSIKVNPERVKDIIGKGGETINKIIDATGVSIDIGDEGQVSVTSADGPSLQRALDWIHDLTREIVAGEIFDAKVVRIVDFGAFVNLIPGKDALCHISQLAPHRVNKVTDVVKEGDILKVKVIEIDSQGRINVSHVAAMS